MAVQESLHSYAERIQMYPNDLAELLGSVRTQCGLNGCISDAYKFCTPEQQEKVQGDIRPGASLKIERAFAEGEDETFLDHGYVFTLPGLEDRDVWMGGIVHIPNPDNPGGMDSVPPVWVTLDRLLKDPLVLKVTVMERIR